MKINKDKFNELWNEVFTRLQCIPEGMAFAEKYYLSGCLDIMRKIKNEMEEKENDN